MKIKFSIAQLNIAIIGNQGERNRGSGLSWCRLQATNRPRLAKKAYIQANGKGFESPTVHFFCFITQ
jgi:hypothetical protein